MKRSEGVIFFFHHLWVDAQGAAAFTWCVFFGSTTRGSWAFNWPLGWRVDLQPKLNPHLRSDTAPMTTSRSHPDNFPELTTFRLEGRVPRVPCPPRGSRSTPGSGSIGRPYPAHRSTRTPPTFSKGGHPLVNRHPSTDVHSHSVNSDLNVRDMGPFYLGKVTLVFRNNNTNLCVWQGQAAKFKYFEPSKNQTCQLAPSPSCIITPWPCFKREEHPPRYWNGASQTARLETYSHHPTP